MSDLIKQVINIDYSRCKPKQCDSNGICAAVLSCKYKILKQDEPFDLPFLNPSRYCHGCAICIQACSLNAIEKRG